MFHTEQSDNRKNSVLHHLKVTKSGHDDLNNMMKKIYAEKFQVLFWMNSYFHKHEAQFYTNLHISSAALTTVYSVLGMSHPEASVFSEMVSLTQNYQVPIPAV